MAKQTGLYNEKFEHDACGIGAITSIKGVKTHNVIDNALSMLERLDHRGGIGADENCGDGAGILLQIPHDFFKKELLKNNIEIPKEGEYAVANIFMPADKEKYTKALDCFKQVLNYEDVEFIALRDVPYNEENIGKMAKDSMPKFIQIFVKKPNNISKGIEFERKLYIVRRETEKKLSKIPGFKKDTMYFESFSSRTIVYKGMLKGTQLRKFYTDLNSSEMKSALALVHSRFSTNTFPSWSKAHPNRIIIHNGEINTIRGNENWFATRQNSLKSKVFGENIDKVLPVINDESASDSARLDNALEFLMMNGKDLEEAIMMTIPEPWDKVKDISEDKRNYYRYNANLMEPWDGPAAIVFTDGEKLGAVLDRNGLRPARYYITNDGYLILSSEVGVLDIKQENIKVKNRLRSGKMILVDTNKGCIMKDAEIKEKYFTKHPYGKWLEDNLLSLSDLKESGEEKDIDDLVKLQQCFGYHKEDIEYSIIPMSTNGAEQIGAMGIDVPLAVLSDRPQLLFNYFKQLFAQVTNPPIDSIREEIVTSTETYIGTEGNILDETEENCRQLKLDTPIITNSEFRKIESLNRNSLKSVVLPILFENNDDENSLQKAMDKLFKDADLEIEKGNNILILSDRGVCREKSAIPSLLAVSGLHHHLIEMHTRTKVALVLESGEPRDSHHFALLLGYGVSAINPYMVYATIKDLIKQDILKVQYEDAVKNYNKAITKGILKILSKMGISTVQSYQGAQIFEAIGLNEEFVDKYFTGTTSAIQGIGIKEVQKEYLMNHNSAFENEESLSYDGSIKYRVGKENHLFSPIAIRNLQNAVRKGDYESYKNYSKILSDDNVCLTLRDVLDFKFSDKPLSLDEVEPVESIVKRFKTGAMSYGSLSKEAHEALAIAMNRIGGKSNSGEGGEDSERYKSKDTENNVCSAIKQVASGRFGVTSEYLVNAQEIQIKIAQGAKPGEGGNLPAKKVYPWIAKTRHSTTGVGLISPPPHHDIYSIEDLSELIYDLKNANREAKISVKLVSEAGVGTVAAGVAKGGAEVIVISGYDGGTGAAARTSIKNAGLPWELGLAEANQTLIKNDLRGRVSLETDGKLMTGRDVAIAALLGADQFGFATAPLVALGCVMDRACNLNTCPMGIATQDEMLRKRFKGKPEHVINFMVFVAQELREYMAKIGFRTVDEMVGRVDKLQQNQNIKGWKSSKLDLSSLLYKEEPSSFNEVKKYDFKLQDTIDITTLIPRAKMSLDYKKSVQINVNVKNTDRAFGTILGSEVTKRYPDGLDDDTIKIDCEGSGGQSFGAFIPKGITISLEGDLNDYAGKGLSGGKIIVYPNRKSIFEHDKNIIAGNVVLYGATSGEAYFNGIAGERFAVRNSGAVSVVEGVGEHGCEYMTGGTVVIIGKIGLNFAAGMSGGTAYIFDEDNSAISNINTSMVYIERLTKDEEKLVKNLISNHYKYTDSKKALNILNDFHNCIKKFIKIMPKDYETMIELIKEKKEEGLSDFEAELAAFNMRH